MTKALERATAADISGIVALLAQHHLPVDGVHDRLATTLVARHAATIVGTAALELFLDGALMRSVAVAPAFRGSGLGQRLTNAILGLAANQHVPAVYLLTTTADRYFPRFGFTRIVREDVPPMVRASVEFTSSCPSTATVMRKAL